MHSPSLILDTVRGPSIISVPTEKVRKTETKQLGQGRPGVTTDLQKKIGR